MGKRQTCAGTIGGLEAAIHAAEEFFSLPETEEMFQIDATNAFNNMNGQLALHNGQNCYPHYIAVTY